MKRTVIRIIRIAALVLLALVVVVGGVLAWAIGTESGSRFLLARAEGLVDGIDIGRVTGRLGGALELTDVSVVVPGIELTVARLWLDWSPSALLGRRLQVADLGAERVRYRMLPTEPEPEPQEPFELPERVELPVAVAVARLQVTDVTVLTAPDAEPLVLDRLLLTDLGYRDARLEVPRLELRAPLLDADGRLAATAAGDYPVDAALDWRLKLEGYTPVDGATRLGGSLARLELDQRLADPYRTRLQATVADLLEAGGTPTVRANLTVDELNPSRLQEGLPGATLSLAVDAEGPFDGLNVTANANGSDPEGRRFVADLAAAVTPERLTIGRLTLRQPGRAGELAGEGHIVLAGDASADLSLTWQALQWPLTGDPTVEVPHGRLSVTGPLDDYRFALETRVEPAATPALDLELNGAGNRRAATVELAARTGAGRADGVIRAAWEPRLEGEATLRAHALDPSVLAAEWPGAIDLELAAAGHVDGERVSATLSRLEAQGRLREQTLAASGTGEFLQDGSGFTLDVPQLVASLGDTRLQLEGRLADASDFRWSLESPDLSALLPEAAGRIAGSGTVTGRLPDLALAARLDGSELGYGEYRLGRLDLDADLDLNGSSPSSLRLVAADGQLGETLVRQVVVEGSGTPADHELSLNADADAGRVRLALSGAADDPWGDAPAWRFTLTEGELDYGELAPWRLAEAAGGRVAPPAFRVERQCWLAEDARLCLEGQGSDQDTTAALSIASLGFGYFAPLLPDELELTGALDATVDVSLPAAGPLLASADLRTTAGQVTLPPIDPERPAPVVGFEPGRVRLDADGSGVRAEAALAFEHGRLEVSGTTGATLGTGAAATTGPVTDQPLEGRVRIDIPDLAFLTELTPAVEEVTGRIVGDLGLAGTVGTPELTGTLRLDDGTLNLPDPGLTLEALTASLEGRGADGLALAASARSGDGELELNGTMSAIGAAPTARLTVVGREFEALDNDVGRVLISPDLTIAADPERLSVTGTLHIPEAELSPGAQAPSAVSVSSDQVLVNPEEETAAEAGRELFADVRLTLGDEVRFSGFGLSARFEGDLRIEQEPNTPTTATGEVRIAEGEYRAYGQGLVIERGRVFFAGGPVTRPALDLRAVRRPADDILVGAHVQGTLEQPTFELFSEPPMSQQDQLAWLVLGRSLEDSPEGQGDALNRAALAMGLKGGDFLAKNIGQRVGVDEIGIQSGSGEAGAPSDPTEASLVVGKYLSPKLYVSYGIGLFNPESVLAMQYEISRNWRLVTQQSSEATGADVLFTVEAGGN